MIDKKEIVKKVHKLVMEMINTNTIKSSTELFKIIHEGYFTEEERTYLLTREMENIATIIVKDNIDRKYDNKNMYV